MERTISSTLLGIFKRPSTATAAVALESSVTIRPLTSQEEEYISSLKKLIGAYAIRASAAFFTGDVIINGKYRTELKALVAKELITAIENRQTDLRNALVTSATKHGFDDAAEFLGGQTKDLLDNNALFELLSTPQISTATVTTTTDAKLIPLPSGP